MAQDGSSVNSDGIFEPFSSAAVPWSEWHGSGGEIARFRLLGKYGGGASVGVTVDELPPGRYSNQLHYHLTEEEHIWILSGAATLYLGARSYVMTVGDYCCFPAGQKAGHHLFNHTETLCTFLTIGENKPDDVYFYPQTKTARIKKTGEVLTIPDGA